MSKKTETDYHVIERREDPQQGRTALDLLSGGLGFFLPHPEPERITSITDKDSGITVNGRGATTDEADQDAWDRLRSEKEHRR